MTFAFVIFLSCSSSLLLVRSQISETPPHLQLSLSFLTQLKSSPSLLSIMDGPRLHEPETLSPCTTSRSGDSNSPEFEFWMVRNPSFPQPNLLSADELFVDGVLLPLHLLSLKPPDPNPLLDPEPPYQEESGDPEPGSQLIHVTTDSANGLSSSKRWKDMFRKGNKKAVAKNTEDNKEKEKQKKRDKKSQSGLTSAELNINIWPFSRSRSAGNGGTRARLSTGAPGARKVSSAPCSRSNSAGESKSRKWPSSPSRNSPIWQVKRGAGGSGGKSSETPKSTKTIGHGGGNNINSNNNGKVRILNLNMKVPMSIGYGHHLSCTSDENSALGVLGGASYKPTNTRAAASGCAGTASGRSDGGAGHGHGHVTSNGNLFNFRSLVTKKVY